MKDSFFFTESYTDYRMFLFAFVHLSSSALAFSLIKKPTQPTHRAINKLYGQDTEGPETVPQAGRSLCMANTTWLGGRREQTLLLQPAPQQQTEHKASCTKVSSW